MFFQFLLDRAFWAITGITREIAGLGPRNGLAKKNAGKKRD
jgi:hypothetical protein